MNSIIFNDVKQLQQYDFEIIGFDEFWNKSKNKEARMHSIHNYPAKFPAFIADKAVFYAQQYGSKPIEWISDVFCGCGTVALEARRLGINFWGCDINPVATQIARAKSSTYNVHKLEELNLYLLEMIKSANIGEINYEEANDRLKYWYSESQFVELAAIKGAIDSLPTSKYKTAYLCLFSSILKPTSRWLTKSIKPQIDPNKIPIEPFVAFEEAISKFIKIVLTEQVKNKTSIVIENCSFIRKKTLPIVDLIITSPPYVTSYEYADLHQLSSLWMGFVDDYKDLRKGTIGSVYNSENYYFDLIDLNSTAKSVVQSLYDNAVIGNAKTKAVARYYADMQTAVGNCYKMLLSNGIAVFLIGDTEYKGVKIENAKHLVESLLLAGFKTIKVSKRRISNKTLSPYRDAAGKFSAEPGKREVYHEEYVVIAHKRGL